MTALAWLVGLVLSACRFDGAAGLPTPTPMDMTHIVRPPTPNCFLAGPAGMQPPPDLVTAAQDLPAPSLYQKARAVFDHEPCTYVAAAFPDRLQVHYVVRSALLNFPDLVTIQINALAADRSTLVIWSRSVYGHSDLGVNQARTRAWLAALQHSSER